jgi:hypothetical protein
MPKASGKDGNINALARSLEANDDSTGPEIMAEIHLLAPRGR